MNADPCPACGANRVLVGRIHNCRPIPRPMVETVRTVDAEERQAILDAQKKPPPRIDAQEKPRRIAAQKTAGRNEGASRGRPRMGDVRMGATVPSALAAKLDAWAAEHGVGRPEAIRRLIENALS